ncbi:hypothetical protein GIB67_007338 [Kingdonia uniflora]|uniref:NAC domain-containing protein n=1 Tax=Kingdonia uniflora TaxID=39325 RepID=A0A7J7NX84_9MAGN|nr:hypothetical protein GIB67_007338 [Kingdonia uniflora]
MESVCEDDQGQIDLPPGFRFHPTDEELITHYLSKKVFDAKFQARAIGEVDLNKNEPWDLAWKAKVGEKHWYFFCLRDRKYPTGLRTNRATEAGYWKATGKDKEIYRAKVLVGMKKTLVFYKGRAPKGEKTNWIMHEYRIEEKCALYNTPNTAKNEWVICRIFEKYSGAKKISILGTGRFGSSLLPPLIDSSGYYTNINRFNPTGADIARVPCFSNQMEPQRNQEHISSYFNPHIFSVSMANTSDTSFSSLPMSKFSQQSSFYLSQPLTNLRYPGSNVTQNQFVMKDLMENNQKMDGEIMSISQQTGLSTTMRTEISSVVANHEVDLSASDGSVDLESLWNY